MNGKSLANIWNDIHSGMVVLNTKSGTSYTFNITNEDEQYSFNDKDLSVICLDTETGTKWVDVSSIESIEL